MLYLCIPSHDEGPTVGLLLWKIRKTLQAFPREYEILVADDGSSDATSEILEPYTKALPLTVIRHGERQGYAKTLEELLRVAVEKTDRPKRDAAIVLHADFTHGPEYLPEIVKRLESGADMVVAQGTVTGEPRRAARLVRKYARWLLRGVQVSGVKDIVSGYGAFRLFCLKNALRDQESGPLLTAEGWAANAELIGRVARHARRIETIEVVERHDLRQRPSRIDPWPLAKQLWRDGGKLRIRGTRPTDSRPGGARADDPELEETAR
ncbi:MAG TPA: glycosyltransferase family 2 protein [Gemmatimonadales bacterium]|nr:glycosyltransferase family 2 protein [Gemmatimonadales bacterium]